LPKIQNESEATDFNEDIQTLDYLEMGSKHNLEKIKKQIAKMNHQEKRRDIKKKQLKKRNNQRKMKHRLKNRF
jgi:hypothetical protein